MYRCKTCVIVIILYIVLSVFSYVSAEEKKENKYDEEMSAAWFQALDMAYGKSNDLDEGIKLMTKAMKSAALKKANKKKMHTTLIYDSRADMYEDKAWEFYDNGDRKLYKYYIELAIKDLEYLDILGYASVGIEAKCARLYGSIGDSENKIRKLTVVITKADQSNKYEANDYNNALLSRGETYLFYLNDDDRALSDFKIVNEFVVDVAEYRMAQIYWKRRDFQNVIKHCSKGILRAEPSILKKELYFLRGAAYLLTIDENNMPCYKLALDDFKKSLKMPGTERRWFYNLDRNEYKVDSCVYHMLDIMYREKSYYGYNEDTANWYKQKSEELQVKSDLYEQRKGKT